MTTLGHIYERKAPAQEPQLPTEYQLRKELELHQKILKLQDELNFCKQEKDFYKDEASQLRTERDIISRHEAEPVDFKIALKRLINKYGQENASDTPDFALATFLDACLTGFAEAVKMRDRYFGVDMWAPDKISRSKVDMPDLPDMPESNSQVCFEGTMAALRKYTDEPRTMKDAVKEQIERSKQ